MAFSRHTIHTAIAALLLCVSLLNPGNSEAEPVSGSLLDVFRPAGSQFGEYTLSSTRRAFDPQLRSPEPIAARRRFEEVYLNNIFSREWITIRSGLPLDSLHTFASLLHRASEAFFSLLGAEFRSPVQGDQNENLTLLIFASRDAYQEYMQRFIGYGAQAGGLYLESTGQLITFQRTDKESAFSLAELLLHEFSHYLQGRYVFPGRWGEDDYFHTPHGWSDEGLAETVAGLELGESVRPAPKPRKQYLNILCTGALPNLKPLLTRRTGYDQPGVFDYASAWALVHYLSTFEHNSLVNLYRAIRSKRYRSEDFLNFTRFSSIEEFEESWHNAIREMCDNDARA